jgi:hypothetical protein
VTQGNPDVRKPRAVARRAWNAVTLMRKIMGLLTDLIIASESDAQKICEAQGAHSKSWPTLALKGVDPVKLATLWKIVSPGAEEEALEGDAFMIYSADSEGPWVFRMPDDLIWRLASLSTGQIREAAAIWARSEEILLDQWTEDDCVTVVTEASALAKKAASIQKPVLLWMCL